MSTTIRTADELRGSATKPGASASEQIARIERVPFSKWHAKASVVMGSATFFDGFNTLSLAFALPTLARLWHIHPKQAGWLLASMYIGQIIGAVLFTWLAEKFGRVPSGTAAIAIMSLMSLACIFAVNLPMLFAIRFLQGIGVGGEVPVAATYINELLGARGRGKIFMSYQMIFPVGLMVTGQLGAWMVPNWGWKPLFLVGGIPSLLVTYLVFRLPESPRWLISKGRLAESDAIVRDMEASTDRRLPPKEAAVAIPPPPAATVAAPAPGRAQRSNWTELFSSFYLWRTLISWTLWAACFFVANGLNNWLPNLYSSVYHLTIKNSLRAASMTNVAQVAVLIVCAFCIDWVGRRNWMFACFVGCAVLLGVLAYTGARDVKTVIILATLAYGFIGSANTVLYLYTPEIYPTRIRAIGTGLSSLWLRVASAIAPVLTGVILETHGVSMVFWVFCGISIVGVFAATRMIQTQNRPLEEIAP